jgi:hypothetical protein
MWVVHDLTARSVTLDFSSSDQGRQAVTQLVIDGVQFTNAAELSSRDNPTRVQLRICEDCGIEGCASGGWMAPRNVGVGVAFIPAFDDMLPDDWRRAEYAPPFFEQSMPLFLPDNYDRLRGWSERLPPIEEVPALTGEELVRCLQWDAPAGVLGKFPAETQLDDDFLLAAHNREVADVAALTQSAIGQTGDESRVWFTPIPPAAQAVTVYLDTPGTPEWAPVYTIDGLVRLAAPIPGHLVQLNHDDGRNHAGTS